MALKEGDRVILDEEFNNASEVTIVEIHGKHFGRVRDDEGDEWEVMLYRLTEIKKPK